MTPKTISNNQLAEIILLNGIKQSLRKMEDENSSAIYLWNNRLWEYRKINNKDTVTELCY